MDSMEQGPQRCTATSKRSGLRCGRWPIKGAKVCANHGGLAPQTKAKAARNLMEGDLRKALERYGRDTPITDPLTALQEHAGKIRAWFDYMEGRITSLRHSSQWDTEQIRGEVELFTRAQETLSKILVDMAKLKIDERLVAIDEAILAMMFDALKAGLIAGGISGPGPTQAAMAAVSQRVRLRVIQGGRRDDDDALPKTGTGY